MKWLELELERLRTRMLRRNPLDCTVCLDSGRLSDNGPCSCRPVGQHLAFAQVPKLYTPARLQTLHPQVKGSAAVAGLVSDLNTRIFILAGPPGRGKSWLAAAWLAAKVNGLERGAWVNVAQFLRQLLSEGNEYALWRFAATRRYAVLDDLGQEHASDWSKAKVHELLEERLSRSLTTCVTLNLSREQIAKRYYEATASRLSAGRRFAVLGDDLRARA